jgi:hypothetical protein
VEISSIVMDGKRCRNEGNRGDENSVEQDMNDEGTI